MNRVEIDLIQVIKEIYKSCSYSFANVIDQIKADIDRMHVFYNDDTTPLNLQTILGLNLPMSVLILCTQASFFYPFNAIHDRYFIDGEQVVTENDDKPVIKILKRNNRYILLFKKSFQVVDSNTLDQLNVFYTYSIVDGNKMTIMHIDRRA